MIGKTMVTVTQFVKFPDQFFGFRYDDHLEQIFANCYALHLFSWQPGANLAYRLFNTTLILRHSLLLSNLSANAQRMHHLQ